MKEIKLHTPVHTGPIRFHISHSSPLLLIGSCFTENIGRRMSDLHFDTILNPFGILYNPLSIAEALQRSLDNRPIDSSVLVEHDGFWHSWLHHGTFSRKSPDECINACNTMISKTHHFLGQCRQIIVTFGSAHYYELQDNGLVVANCHKLPSKHFSLQMASVDEIVAAWTPLMQRLRQNDFEVLFTVSPVRHNAYGAHGNQLGKAALLLAIDQLCRQFGADYFPAYEIVVDELRDYRFYADDLSHPSALAEQIVWQRLQMATMSQSTIDLCDQYDSENRRTAHRTILREDDYGEVKGS